MPLPPLGTSPSEPVRPAIGQPPLLTLCLRGTMLAVPRFVLDFMPPCNRIKAAAAGLRDPAVLRTNKGVLFFSRNPNTFQLVLDYYDNGRKLPAGLDRAQLSALRAEANFFRLPDLADECKMLYPLREAARAAKALGDVAAQTATLGQLQAALGRAGRMEEAQRKGRRIDRLQAAAPLLRNDKPLFSSPNRPLTPRRPAIAPATAADAPASAALIPAPSFDSLTAPSTFARDSWFGSQLGYSTAQTTTAEATFAADNLLGLHLAAEQTQHGPPPPLQWAPSAEPYVSLGRQITNAAWLPGQSETAALFRLPATLAAPVAERGAPAPAPAPTSGARQRQVANNGSIDLWRRNVTATPEVAFGAAAAQDAQRQAPVAEYPTW